jgi:predicted acyltransferase
MKGDVGILGGYFNDNGINIMHDDFFMPMIEETNAILKVVRDEARESIALGILSTVSSVGITLLGYFAGVILKRDKKSGLQKTGLLFIIGAGLIVLSLLISPFYPVIKNCWTSTFTLLAGGISFLLVALIYLS